LILSLPRAKARFECILRFLKAHTDMQQVLIVIHLLIVIALVAVILLQRSEQGALSGLGGGGGGGGLGGLMTGRSQANLLTRTRAIRRRRFLAQACCWPSFRGIRARLNLPLIRLPPLQLVRLLRNPVVFWTS